MTKKSSCRLKGFHAVISVQENRAGESRIKALEYGLNHKARQLLLILILSASAHSDGLRAILLQ
ncbi:MULTISPECIES: hypothetical protein [unclassified Neisseria]|uniref:hypothetical protein n=1 Tax=unclassified Neisseria TaxID=2623750 RepID=UPI0010721676|nr:MULTISPECIES: hypothetical protein [unclassified Neisseria]TFU40249.1 hypothetical protein E4T99_10365 [Neisseria sp. WF04]